MRTATNTKNGKTPAIELEVQGLKLGLKEAEIKRPHLDTIHIEMKVIVFGFISG